MIEWEETNCTCDVCKSFCKGRPGWFLPGEASRLAEAMRVPLKKLFSERLGIDYWCGYGGSDTLLLCPAWPPAAQPGTLASWGAVFDRRPCVFLDPDVEKCSIYEYRPAECRKAYHAGGAYEHTEWRKALVEEWKEDQSEINLVRRD